VNQGDIQKVQDRFGKHWSMDKNNELQYKYINALASLTTSNISPLLHLITETNSLWLKYIGSATRIQKSILLQLLITLQTCSSSKYSLIMHLIVMQNNMCPVFEEIYQNWVYDKKALSSNTFNCSGNKTSYLQFIYIKSKCILI